MSDVLHNPYPQRFIDPSESGLVAGYTPHVDNELAVWGRVLNRASTGAVYDLTRSGTPIVGQGSGVYARNSTTAFFSGPVAAYGASDFSHTLLTEMSEAPAGFQLLLTTTGQRFYANVDGTLWITANAGGVFSSTTFPVLNRGPVWTDLLFDGTNQILVANGRQSDTDAVVPNAPGATFSLGFHNTHRLAKVYNVRRTVAQARASYVRDFAKQVVWSWTPTSVGEGPAGGILTNSTPGGYATCPSGGATLQFVWRPDLSIPAGGRLALTDNGAISMRRIAIAHTRQPVFGSWDFSFDVRDPLTDDVIIGLTPLPETDPTVAGSGSFWFRSHRVPNPWWRTEVHFENGASIIDVDMADVIQAGDRIHVRVTHDVSGNWRVYAYNSRQNSWYWRNAVGNSVATLTSNYVVAAPRGSYLFGVSKQQGEATPHEAGIKVP